MSNIHPIQIGPQNKHVLDNVAKAYQAALALANDGFTVLDVKVGQRNPIIEIQPCRQCRQLHGALRMIDNTGPHRCDVYAARYRGAQVEWRESA